MRTCFLDTTKEAALRAFWETAHPLKVISAQWGCSDSYVSQLAKRIGLPSRKPRVQEIRRQVMENRFQGRVENFRYFQEAAAARGITVDQLRNKILSTVINDRIVDAVLDDADRAAA